MTRYEYKVCPAPAKGRKDKGLKTPEARFALAVEMQINLLAADGWQYQRTDILPSEERQGLTSSRTVYRTVMVFRRALDGDRTPHIARDDDQTSGDDDRPASPLVLAAPARITVAPDRSGPPLVAPPRRTP